MGRVLWPDWRDGGGLRLDGRNVKCSSGGKICKKKGYPERAGNTTRPIRYPVNRVIRRNAAPDR